MKQITCCVLAIAVLAGCVAKPTSVKNRWNGAIKSFSFVPLYPPRNGISVGDIRIHTQSGGSQTLDSRKLWSLGDITTYSKPTAVATVLPGVEVLQVGAFDLSPLGLKGFFGQLFGNRVEFGSQMSIVLAEMTTTEISSQKTVDPFHKHLKGFLQDPRWATIKDQEARGATMATDPRIFEFCADAISLLGPHPNWSKLRVSMITRTFSAGNISYANGRRVSTLSGTPEQPGEGQDLPTPPKDETGFARSQFDAITKLNGKQRDVVVGVDAVVLKPMDMQPALEDACKSVAKDVDFARLSELGANTDPDR